MVYSAMMSLDLFIV